ncbi:hypothetical protein [Streptomyces sp. Wb2n-11]|uniref:hypothetical protein n=1 Tax=Streptomyces sp. Wb2n-11 TaxID=1030533 RepID=UPI00210004C1|nr:hypothetical protein [Streptomyces sp. Wb2n-11]
MSNLIDGDRRPPAGGRCAAPVYVLLPIDTDAARAEAAALAEDRARLLAGQGITVSADPTRALLQEPGALGLYEDGILAGALVLHEDPDMRHWGADGREPGLLVSLDPATVGSSQVGRLLTLWLADHAADNHLMWVWCEVPSRPGSVDAASEWLLKHLRGLGWQTRTPAVLSPAGGRVARLRLGAEARPALAAAISTPPAGAPAAVRTP